MVNFVKVTGKTKWLSSESGDLLDFVQMLVVSRYIKKWLILLYLLQNVNMNEKP